MQYKVIGIMSGSALDGLDIAYVHFTEQAGKWNFEIIHAVTETYSSDWVDQLRNATNLSAVDYQLLHTDYGHYIGKKISAFIEQFNLHHQVHLIASHGHTTFHLPSKLMTGQIGDGAAIAAETGLPVISDLRAIDVALGGQGAPIVPMGEMLLFPEYNLFLNLGGIANLSFRGADNYIAFDVCAANRVLNMLANTLNMEYDTDGKTAATGTIDPKLFEKLNFIQYYGQPYPKSLANDFGVSVVYPLLAEVEVQHALRTYVEHIALQVKNSLSMIASQNVFSPDSNKLLLTGGGALNKFLIERIQVHLEEIKIEVVVPEKEIVNFKEALVMALLGVRRWREETTVMSSVTGATRDSIGGAMWIG